MLGQSTGNLDSLDSPRPGLGGSHHLPPYNILCSSPQRLHPNDIFSWDSQGGVPKLSRFGLLGLWASITSCSYLRLGWGLKQSCSSLWELSNAMLHSSWKRWIWVNSWLLVVGSQTGGPSFAYNLGFRCPNDSCEGILDICTSRSSNGIKNIPMQGVLTLVIELWIFRSLGGLQLPTFGSVSFILTLIPKWGCNTSEPNNKQEWGK